MAYRSHWDENAEEFVTSAINDYRFNENSTRGYDILRYAERGYILVCSSVDPNIFVEWYPCHQGYVLLRLAKQGKLSFKHKET